MTGFFVTFEGVDGVGKSTQIARLADRLRAAGRDVVATREPGGSPGAEEIRALLVGGAADRWSAATEALLFTAARRDHLERTIEPALAAGRTVLCDRYIDSTRAYQSAGRGGDPAFTEALHGLAIGRDPDLTLIFDAPNSALAARRAAKAAGAEGRFERFDDAFHKRLRDAFLAIAAGAPERCRVIDATQPIDAVAAAAWTALEAALPR